MSTNYHWANRCRDCFMEKPLQELVDVTLVNPFVRGFHLCSECLIERKNDQTFDKEVRPFGIPADIATAEWIDLSDLIVDFGSDVGSVGGQNQSLCSTCDCCQTDSERWRGSPNEDCNKSLLGAG